MDPVGDAESPAEVYFSGNRKEPDLSGKDGNASLSGSRGVADQAVDRRAFPAGTDRVAADGVHPAAGATRGSAVTVGRAQRRGANRISRARRRLEG